MKKPGSVFNKTALSLGLSIALVLGAWAGTAAQEISAQRADTVEMKPDAAQDPIQDAGNAAGGDIPVHASESGKDAEGEGQKDETEGDRAGQAQREETQEAIAAESEPAGPDAAPAGTEGDGQEPDAAPAGAEGDGQEPDAAPAGTEGDGQEPDAAPAGAEGDGQEPDAAPAGTEGDGQEPDAAPAGAEGDGQEPDAASAGAEGDGQEPDAAPAGAEGDMQEPDGTPADGAQDGSGTEDDPEDPETPQAVEIDLGELFYQAEDQAERIAGEYDLAQPWLLEKDGEPAEDGIAREPGIYRLTGENVQGRAVEISFSVVKLPVAIIPHSIEKTYGNADPLLTYDVKLPEEAGPALSEQAVCEELGEVLQRESGETVRESGYAFSLCTETASEHYEPVMDSQPGAVFMIRPLAVTVTPLPGQGKYYGEKEPEVYDFTVAYEASQTQADPETVKRELLEGADGVNVLTRQPGEDVARPADGCAACAQYPFALSGYEWTNYSLSLAEEVFEIRPLTPVASQKRVTSREDSFEVAIAELEEKEGASGGSRIDESIPRRVVITAKFPEDNAGIRFDEDLETYIPGAGEAKGLAFAAGSASRKISICESTYQRTQEEGKPKPSLSWKGRLPAGTKLEISIFGENGVVSTAPARLTVVKQPVAVTWGSTADEDPAPNYLSRADRLTLTALTPQSREEYVLVRSGSAALCRQADTVIDPAEFGLAGSAGRESSVSAVFADSLNLEYEEAVYSFTYDDTAMQIPSESIRFSNRDTKISLTLPEPGIVTQISIPDAQVKLTGEMGTQFSLDVDWSARALIRSGSGIEVRYTDRAGNTGTGHAQVGRSSVETPIRMQIRPDVNARGYLTGSGTLIVSGSACSWEQIRVRVAGAEQMTNAAGRETWADENGSWELLFERSADMLPERKEFLIAAEYMDVNGEGALRRAVYDAFVNNAALVTPVFRGMPCIGGVVEPGCAVLLHIGEHTYEVETKDNDSCGYFLAEDVELMMPGDTFTVEVIDIAGNSNTHTVRTVPAADDPAGISASLGPEGEFFYDPAISDSRAYTATPVDVAGLKDSPLELPLLFGACYEAGQLTLTRTERGMVVRSELDPLLASEGRCEITDEVVYVYPHRPSVEELRNQTGMQYRFGEEIPVRDDETVWIVDGRMMKIQAGEYGDILFRGSGRARSSGEQEGTGQGQQ